MVYVNPDVAVFWIIDYGIYTSRHIKNKIEEIFRFQRNGYPHTKAKTRVGAPELRANFIGAIAT